MSVITLQYTSAMLLLPLLFYFRRIALRRSIVLLISFVCENQ